ncbi:hypothetical protein CRX72_00120 [Pantoea sp. BRM17]|nr:hypothetical protein CRX72_00120 [Pantoea sp. BRM17]
MGLIGGSFFYGEVVITPAVSVHSNTRHPMSSDKKQSLSAVTLAAIGVVYGDIGTSPLYTLRECLSGQFGFGVEREAVFGFLSLIFWLPMLECVDSRQLFCFRRLWQHNVRFSARFLQDFRRKSRVRCVLSSALSVGFCQLCAYCALFDGLSRNEKNAFAA